MGRAQNGKNGPSRNNNGIRPTKPTLLSSKSIASGHRAGASKGSSEPGKPTTDRSQLNFPYDVRLNGYSSIHNAVTKGTPRVRRILMEECDYIMECRVCRNLFRSLPNFITHKLSYCKKLFDSTWCIGLSNLIQTSDMAYNIEYEVDPALLLDEGSSAHPNNTRSVTDLYSEIAMKARKCDSSEQLPTHPENGNENSVRLQLKPLVNGPSGCVVLQQRVSSDPSSCDISSAHMNLVQTVPKDTAILGPDGKVMCTGSSKGIEQIVARLSARMQEMEKKRVQQTNATNFSCDICKTVFDSEKALRQHKRESLDCGRTWGFKAPISESSAGSSSISDESNNSQDESQSSRCSKLLSPTHRRQSLKMTSLSPSKPKRSLSLSPAKKIRMKYFKYDSNVAAGDGRNSLSCSRCSSRFSTKHEMFIAFSHLQRRDQLRFLER